MKLEFELDQRDLGLKEPPRPDQIYDFSLLRVGETIMDS